MKVLTQPGHIYPTMAEADKFVAGEWKRACARGSAALGRALPQVEEGVRRMTRYVLMIVMLLTLPAWGFDHDHALWDRLLKEHVVWSDDGHASRVDYVGFARDAEDLKRYLDTLSSVTETRFEQWSPAQRLAFLINAYNAFTIQLILDNWPVESIRDIGSFFSSPWSRAYVPLLGEVRSLDEIEHGMIRAPGVHDDPRIHFAVNCASAGCPALRPEAFVASNLSSQLGDGTARFLSDRQRNRIDCAAGRAEVSPIFKWYAEDFEREAGSVSAWLINRGCPDEDVDTLSISFTPYDWSLNATKR